MEPVDIVLLSYNRLDYLVRTVDTLFERTPEPFRLTIVDNASSSDVRNWLAANRGRFHQLILQPVNEHIAGFQRGIEATTSDPFVLAEPDLLVPALDPSWLARLRAIMDRHPDFGLIGVGLDHTNRPSVFGPETFAEEELVDGEIVEGNVGIWFQMIRRDALRVRYVKDSAACMAIRQAGYRVGWTPAIRALHLGWDDYRLHPAHLASKNELPSPYPYYHEVELIGRPPALAEVARAAPLIAELRKARVPDEAVLEIAWADPVVGSVLDATTLHPPPPELGFADAAAGAVVLVTPPPELAERALAEALRVASSLVAVVGPLTSFGGRSAAQLAPPGWSGREVAGVGVVPLELARSGDELPLMATHHRYTTLEDRERWLSLFARAAIPPETDERLFVFEAERAAPSPARVKVTDTLVRWRPPPLPAPPPPSWRWRLRHALATRAPSSLRRVVRAFSGGRRGG